MADTQLRLEGGHFHAIGSGGLLGLRFSSRYSREPLDEAGFSDRANLD